jgi:hypothetical protein
MSSPFTSFEFLNRGWDVRLLEGQSLRTVFVVLLVDLFMLGMITFMDGTGGPHNAVFVVWGISDLSTGSL